MRIKNVSRGLRTLDDLIRTIEKLNNDLVKLTNNQVTFADNLDSQELTIADTGTADTIITGTHTLGRVPTNFIPTYIDKAGIIYDDGTTWTATEIYLKCSAANASAKVLIY